jgi:catechol 2,3-dioxygenase-like lactoylglutathione lyase family enzyme
MKLQKIDHIGIVVHDLAAAKAFFVELGFEAGTRQSWKASGWARSSGCGM